mmetsp:Transcript_7610/g.9385  ORF Transcript_7610/g.9385 Transcript_7610/m.9385 type:complete len:114 (+) Transcript_7610:62-403(+)
MHKTIICYRCNRYGHYSDQCPGAECNVQDDNDNENNNVGGANAVQKGHNQAQDGDNAIEIGLQAEQDTTNLFKSLWFLLNSCSTGLCVNNKQFLNRLKQSNESKMLTLYTNGG